MPENDLVNFAKQDGRIKLKIDLEHFHENKHFWILEGDGVAFRDALRDMLDQDGPLVHRMVSHSEFDLVLFMLNCINTTKNAVQ